MPCIFLSCVLQPTARPTLPFERTSTGHGAPMNLEASISLQPPITSVTDWGCISPMQLLSAFLGVKACFRKRHLSKAGRTNHSSTTLALRPKRAHPSAAVSMKSLLLRSATCTSRRNPLPLNGPPMLEYSPVNPFQSLQRTREMQLSQAPQRQSNNQLSVWKTRPTLPGSRDSPTQAHRFRLHQSITDTPKTQTCARPCQVARCLPSLAMLGARPA